MEFNYYYGSQADQFSFIRIPKVMLTEKLFSDLSISAKVLYGVLLDRMTLSRKNAWFDEENRVFIIYQIGEIQEDLGFSKKKAMDLLSELEKFGLLEKKRRGHGLPNILYVKSFMTGLDTGKSSNADSVEEPGNTSGPQSRTSEPKNTDSRSAVDGTSRSAAEWTSRSADFGTSRVPNSEPLRVPISAPLKNKTDINNTDWNNIESNLILSSGSDEIRSDEIQSDKVQADEIRSTNVHAHEIRSDKVQADEIRSDKVHAHEFRSDMIQADEKTLTDAEVYEQIIRENIGYEDLLISHPHDRELIEGIAALILETVLVQSDTIVIASNRYPAAVVKARFLKLNYSHIEYVLFCFKRNTTKVSNIRKYLLAALFNALPTICGYYQAEVNHDMPELAACK